MILENKLRPHRIQKKIKQSEKLNIKVNIYEYLLHKIITNFEGLDIYSMYISHYNFNLQKMGEST